jgi:glycosyltransferase involved in cell wall biosynthesis
MKISIVTPCFNAGKTLEDAYRSVASQQGVEFEMLVADDGSTDGTIETIRSIAAQDSRVIPLIAETNAGVSNARNRALDAATGDFVFFLDADDKLEPKCFTKLSGGVVDDTIDFVRGKHFFWWPIPDVTQTNPDEERNFVEVQAVTPASYPQIVAVYSSWNAFFAAA